MVFDLDITPGRMSLVMSSEELLLGDACAGLRRFLEQEGLGGEYFALALGLREAVSNAIRHGNGADPDKPVRVDVVVDGEDVRMDVADAGPGWDWAGHDWSLPDAESAGGRGLFILKNYMDDVQYNAAGNVVHLRIRVRKGEDMTNGIGQDSRTIILDKDIAAGSVDQYKEHFRGLIDDGVRELVLDCGKVEIIDSIGIGLLVATHNSLGRMGGGLVLVNTPDDVHNLLHTMRLDKHFRVEKG